ncbi:MAG: type II secretion system inner membrane protein GspF [Magnetococcales bacterium]|nr:type II secretion system inner membrane protein GspF [Magnetococcales bacterium]
MGAFNFTALDGQGKNRTGVLEGDTARHVRSRLRERGLTPLDVTAVQDQKPRRHAEKRPFKLESRIRSADIALVTRQLATLVRSGSPLEEALAVVSRQTSRANLSGIVLSVRSRVMEGNPLASALGGFPKLFDSLFCQTIAAGEQSGRLDLVLERLADHLEKSQKLKQKVTLAMIYPAIVLIFSILVTTALLAYVVPEVVQVFADMKQTLPLLTRIMIALSDTIRDFGWLIVLAIVGLFFGMRALLRIDLIRWRWDRTKLRLPLISRVIRGMETARFVRTFGILVSSGAPVLDGLETAGKVLGNLPMRQAVEEAAQEVREGGALYPALDRQGLFSPMVLHLIASGEAGGDLAGMLDRAAEAQEQEVEALVTTLAGVVEPLLILMMGGLVLTIVMAILMPIFDLNQLIL